MWNYVPISLAVEDAGIHGVHVGGSADEQDDDEAERLEVEEGGLVKVFRVSKK